MHQNKPQLIIGGASKSGTTALYYYLRQHPEICLSEKKELHYFSRPWLEHSNHGPGDSYMLAEIPSTIEKYLSFFEHCENKKVVADISPSYLYHYKSADSIKHELGQVRFVFILRNPADKAYSQYMHLIGAGRETLEFEDALAQESDRYVKGYSDMWLYKRSGFYFTALTYFINAFGEQNVKIIFHDELLSNPEHILNEICQFSGLDTGFMFHPENNVNRSGKPRSKVMAKIISPNVFTYVLRRFMPRTLGRKLRNTIKKLNMGAKPAISIDIRNDLIAAYKDDIRRVEKLVGRDSGWIN